MKRHDVMGRMVRSVVLGCVPVVLLMAALSVPSRAQPAVPYQGGQWSLPYELGPSLTEDGDGNPTTSWPTFEIAHMLLAPPARNVGEPRSDRVLLQCVPGADCSGCTLPTTGLKFGRLYRWTPRTPSNATLIPVPAAYPQDGSQDFFCGGHTFLGNGDLIWPGGTDRKRQCEDCALGYRFFGHKFAWRLDLGNWMPSWVAAGQMGYERWYPTATLQNDGRPLVQGHTAEPMLDQDARRDLLTTPLGSTWTTTDNTRWSAPPTGCNLTTLVDLEDYPRLHLLSTGELFWGPAFEEIGSGPGATFIPNPSKFLDIKPQPWSCPTKRWRDGPLTSRIHINGSSLHFITWDKLSDTFNEVIYVIGGAETPIEGDVAECAAAGTGILSTVEKIVNPTGGGTATWQSVPSLNYARVNHNAVILLDGSIWVPGGHGSENGVCVSRLVPERYRPLEVFENIVAPGPGWQLLAPQGIARRCHSGAVLLPDGRPVSGGGVNLPNTEPDWDKPDHTVEVYSPYYFFDQPRPEIDAATLNGDPATNPYFYGDQPFFEVTASATIDRVALIRNGAATHGFDSDQRYVELRFADAPVAGQPNKRKLTVDMPPDGYWAPPGYYLLTVTDVNNMPSPAEWIRIQ